MYKVKLPSYTTPSRRLSVSKAAYDSFLAQSGRYRGGRHGGGRKIGEVEEWYVEQLTPGDTFLFGGQVWRFEGVSGNDARAQPSGGSTTNNY